jgi:hypothetical protein
MEFLLPFHIAAGGVALAAGALALAVRKGAPAHRRGGLAFVATMLVMGLTGAAIAAAHASPASVVAGLLTAYLVTTALLTVRAAGPGSRRAAGALMLAGLGIGLVSVAWGIDGMARHGAVRDGVPTAIYFVFGGVALLGGAGDLRLLRAGGIAGARRLARHLWRMCFAFWIATASFFMGQAAVIPAPLRIMPLLATLAFLPLAAMLYWLWRVRLRGSLRGVLVAAPPPATSAPELVP